MRIGGYIGCTILISLLSLGGFTGMLASQLEAIPVNAEIPDVHTVTTETALDFPIVLEDMELILTCLVKYEGDMLETGSFRFLVDAAALEIENTDKREILTLEAILHYPHEDLTFFGTNIPGNSSILLIEQSGAPWTDQLCTGYTCRIQYEYLPDNDQGLMVLETGDTTLAVTNYSDSPKEDIWIYYKNYLSESDIYLGGITYLIQIDSIAPGETRVIKPYRYVRGYSKVVKVSVLG